jgi:uncharacterized membrane protein
MHRLATLSGFFSLLLAGAIFGFFYAWICSTMWGLDAADPRVAIAAMQAMNASVRNAVFAPAFFGTPAALLLTAALAGLSGHRRAALAFGLGGLCYLFGGMVLTMAVNVPMNRALAEIVIPDSRDAAATLWADYSARWQLWNQVRTGFSGLALLLAGVGLMCLRRPPA